MKRLLITFICSLASLTAFSSLHADDNDQDIQVQARGPVHEGFAQPYTANPEPPPAIDRKPPDPIPEEPAAEKPEGKNVQWIPGYWQWDADKNDFIWISGMWRDIPVGRRWVMGYWAKTAEGYRWVNGHFADANERDNQYVPEPPPENQDEGPNTAPPDDSSSYVPGAWFYGDDGYTYRTGYWTQCYDDRVWIPSYYNWTPYGYEFCSGYWDYPLARRGLLFAPVYFARPLWYAANWFFRPYYAIGFPGLYSNFFVGYGYRHYYFGDYYARSYLNRGIYPWFWGSRYHYDPIWAHQRWVHRGDNNWAHNFNSHYVARVNGTASLPPRTLAAQRSLAAGGRFDSSQRMVHSLADARRDGVRLQAVSQQQRARQLQSARTMMNQSRNLSRAAPRVSVASQTRNFNRVGSIGTPRSSTTANSRGFNQAFNREGTPRLNMIPNSRGFNQSGSRPSTARFSSPSGNRPAVPRNFSQSGNNRPSMPRIMAPSSRGLSAGSAPQFNRQSGPRITTSPSQGSPRIFTPSGGNRLSAPRSFGSPSAGRMFSPQSGGRSSAPSSGGRSFAPSSGGFNGGFHGGTSGGFHGGGNFGGSHNGGGHSGGGHRR